ncbi:hypothetical protein RRG08_018412 [Elysia crispata]|uniref:Uncharacterized protein n=1 Tax=Elysia crispata TaxID=231223 RepID=A0AAE0XRM8_9GAST|nr:hypothetical protein RRG08_018412 [Elysia crispata]
MNSLPLLAHILRHPLPPLGIKSLRPKLVKRVRYRPVVHRARRIAPAEFPDRCVEPFVSEEIASICEELKHYQSLQKPHRDRHSTQAKGGVLWKLTRKHLKDKTDLIRCATNKTRRNWERPDRYVLREHSL